MGAGCAEAALRFAGLQGLPGGAGRAQACSSTAAGVNEQSVAGIAEQCSGIVCWNEGCLLTGCVIGLPALVDTQVQKCTCMPQAPVH